MKTNHTPGPWAILEQPNDGRTHISNGAHIVCSLGTTRTDGSPNHYANGRLIASAPELLSALSMIVEHAEKYGAAPLSAVKMFDLARVAIAKAKGEA